MHLPSIVHPSTYPSINLPSVFLSVSLSLPSSIICQRISPSVHLQSSRNMSLPLSFYQSFLPCVHLPSGSHPDGRWVQSYSHLALSLRRHCAAVIQWLPIFQKSVRLESEWEWRYTDWNECIQESYRHSTQVDREMFPRVAVVVCDHMLPLDDAPGGY